jgi:hypothetical protein
MAIFVKLIQIAVIMDLIRIFQFLFLRFMQILFNAILSSNMRK